MGFSLAFLLHEAGHALVARKLGLKTAVKLQSLFKFDPNTYNRWRRIYVSSVEVGGGMTRKQIGQVTAAGPVINIIQAAATLPWVSTLPVMKALVILNLAIVSLNILPISTVDGWHVLAWSKKVWSAILVLDVLLWVVFFLSTA